MVQWCHLLQLASGRSEGRRALKGWRVAMAAMATMANMATALSAENMQHNARITYYCKTFLSIIAGIVAGVMGLTGIAGFVCYLFIMAVASLGIFLKAGGQISTYFDSWQRVALDGVSQGAMSFILFWTLAYDIVHIF